MGPLSVLHVSPHEKTISCKTFGSSIRRDELIQLHFSIKGRSVDFQGLGSQRDIIVHHLECEYLAFNLFERQDFG